MKRTYLDHAAVTPVRKEVLKEIIKGYKKFPGNPSSIHTEGVAAKKAVEAARAAIAKTLKAHADEVVFTASGTEANNLALLGAFRHVIRSGADAGAKPHALISAAEHASVRECVPELAKMGIEVETFGLMENGSADLADLRKKLKPSTVLVSSMAVNNETGAVTQVPELAKIVKKHRNETKNVFPLLHVDASQAPSWLEVNMERWHADLATFDGHKIEGPRGVGMLYVRRGVVLDPVIVGGGQERGLRSGTENVPGILGLAKAFELAHKEREKVSAKIRALADRIAEGVREAFPKAVRNGSPETSVPGILNFSIPGTDTEFLTLELDAEGFAVSTKSSCLRDEGESYVLKAMGRPHGLATASLRISLGRATKESQVRKFVKALRSIALRHASFSDVGVVQ